MNNPFIYYEARTVLEMACFFHGIRQTHLLTGVQLFMGTTLDLSTLR